VNEQHRDCRNFAPIDVIKGICHRTKQSVLADDPACRACERLPRCAECRHYAAGQDAFLGTCAATPEHPMTYPDLVAVTCEWFDWRDG
jgi:4-hydroxyphenylacetate decarboxylase small subunit